jgi:hypothetical protein
MERLLPRQADHLIMARSGRKGREPYGGNAPPRPGASATGRKWFHSRPRFSGRCLRRSAGMQLTRVAGAVAFSVHPASGTGQARIRGTPRHGSAPLSAWKIFFRANRPKTGPGERARSPPTAKCPGTTGTCQPGYPERLSGRNPKTSRFFPCFRLPGRI